MVSKWENWYFYLRKLVFLFEKIGIFILYFNTPHKMPILGLKVFKCVKLFTPPKLSTITNFYNKGLFFEKKKKNFHIRYVRNY